MPEFKGLTIALDVDSSGIKKGMSQLNKELSASASLLRATNKELKFDPKNTELLSQKFNALQKSMQLNQDKVKSLKAELVNLEKANVDGKKSAEIDRLKASITNAEGNVRSFKNQMDNLKNTDPSKNIANTSTNLTNLAGAVGVAKASFDAFKSGFNQVFENVNAFDKGVDTIIKKTGGINAEFKDIAVSVSKNTGVAFGEVSSVLGELNTRFDFTGEKLRGATDSFVKFAKVNDLEVNTAVRNVSRAMNDAGIDSNNYQSVLDSLTFTAQKTGVGIDSLTENLTKYGAPLRALGFDTSQAIALFGQWEKTGVNTEIAFSGMKKAISNFASQGKDAKVEFANVLKEIQKTGDISKATTKSIEIFGAKAGPDLADAILSGKFAIDDIVKSLGNVGGTTEKTFSQINNSGLEQFNKTLNILGVSLGEAFAPLDSTIGDVFKKLNDFFISISESPDFSWVLQVVSGIGAISTAAIGISAIFAGWSFIAPAIIGAFAPLGTLFAGLSAPILAVGVAIAGLGVLVYNNFDKIKQSANSIIKTFSGIWSQIQPKLQPLIDFFSKTFNEAIGLLVPFVQETWSQINSIFVSAIGVITNLINNVLAPAFKIIADVFTNYVMPVLMPMLERMKTSFGVAFEIIKTIITTALNVINNVFQLFSNVFSGNWSAAWENVKNIFSSAVNGLINIAKNIGSLLVNGLSNLGPMLWNAFASAFNYAKTAFVSVDWGQVGRDIISGIGNGLKSAAGNLFNSMKNIAGDLLNAGKQALGIKSPSRVFRDVVGKMIPEGIAVGIEANSKTALDSIKNLSSDISGAGDFGVAVNSARNSGVFNDSNSGYASTYNNSTQNINVELGGITIGNVSPSTANEVVDEIIKKLNVKLGGMVNV